MTEPKRKRWPWIVGALLVLGGIQELMKDRTAEREAAAIPRVVAKTEKPSLCAGYTVEPTANLALCSETGTNSGAVELRDQSGASLGTVAPGTKIYRLEGDEILRGPGHVDDLVCVISGERMGVVAYAKNTHFFVEPCAAD